MNPYYQDEWITLYHGDMQDILPALNLKVDLVVADPPYEETSLIWDRWPTGWPGLVLSTRAARSLWCFASMRTLLKHSSDFTDHGWRMSQDVVWEKHNGSGFATDRFKRVHEHITHWYWGAWEVYHQTPRVPGGDGTKSIPRRGQPTHTGAIASGSYFDDGYRLTRSVIRARSMHHSAITPTEKPVGILRPLIEYGCPPGGTILDPFAGSGSSGVAARELGRHAVLIEQDESTCEDAVMYRLRQQPLPVEVPQ